MSRNIVFEGWLTKSPPNRRIWRTRWRRRWFALRQSGELPGQYFLDYYADRNCRRLKGTINLDLCEQVDAGLHMERNNHAPLDPRIRGSVFTIQTQQRTYHLQADCESEMEQWVDAICRVCGLRSTEEVPPRPTMVSVETQQPLPAGQSVPTSPPCPEPIEEPQPGPSSRPDTYRNTVTTMIANNDHYECPDGTGPYIPISECITGVRVQDEQRAFTFDPKNIVSSQMYTSQPHIRLNNSEFSENDSNTDEEEGALHASQQNISSWSITKSFTKLSVSPKKNGASEDGPPVPPRPPKTLATRNLQQKDQAVFQGAKIQEPESSDSAQKLRVPRRMSQGAPSSPGRVLIPAVRTDDEEEISPGPSSMQYYNLPSLPPAVDRNLKPRHSSQSVGQINTYAAQAKRKRTRVNNNYYTKKCPYCGNIIRCKRLPPIPETSGVRAPVRAPAPLPVPENVGPAEVVKSDTLQYLDLDLPTSKPPSSKENGRRPDIIHGKSKSSIDADSAYKTVDFLKTEAFNITRQDAEAARTFQC